MQDTNNDYTFPWGFHLGDLYKMDSQSVPLYTTSEDGGFCLLYDKTSEKKVDNLLESLCLQLLSTMPHESLKVEMFDFGKKKFYNLSPLQHIQVYENAFDEQQCSALFTRLENMIISRYTDLLCCNRQTINEHNQKSKLKQMHHLVLINLEHFPQEDISLRRIQNFVESAQKAGVYVIAFANQEIQNNESQVVQTILQHFKNIKVTQEEFNITEDIFEFVELLEDHTFEPLNLDKNNLMQKVLVNANLEQMMDPETIKLEEDTKVL